MIQDPFTYWIIVVHTNLNGSLYILMGYVSNQEQTGSSIHSNYPINILFGLNWNKGYKITALRLKLEKRQLMKTNFDLIFVYFK